MKSQLRGELRDMLSTVNSDVEALEALVAECTDDTDTLSPEDLFEISNRLLDLAGRLTESANALRVVPEEITEVSGVFDYPDSDNDTLLYRRMAS